MLRILTIIFLPYTVVSAPERRILTNVAIGSACVAAAALLAPAALVGGLGIIGFSAAGPVAGRWFSRPLHRSRCILNMFMQVL